MFQISGASLCDSDSGRAHAAAHRIAFEALLEPSPVLVCPICDLPQKTSELACVFGCMFNDLDLVEHLEQEHGEVLRDEMVCDFSDPRYLFTTFRQKQTPSTPSSADRHAIDEANAVNDERNTIILSDGDVDSNASDCDDLEEKYSRYDSTEESSFEECQDGRDVGSDASEPGVVTANRSKSVRGHETSLSQESPAETTGFGNEHRNDGAQTSVNIGTNRIREHTEGRKREQMKGVSFIACLICDWSPLMFRDSHKMREEISSHVRSHIREEANKLPSRADNSITDQRLLSCMDFSLEEYFEKEHLTDLSGTINSRIMERVYSDLLTKLFGICVPVVYRILHGNNGNPFRPPDAARNRRKAKVSSKSKDNPRLKCLSGTLRTFKRTLSNSTETTESSNADSTTQESSDLPGIGNFESVQHIQCARAECGHSLLTPADKIAIVHHIAAHIRHDEARLLSRAGASPVVTCDCGVTIGSPMGYIYHVVHDHVFEQRQFSQIAATIVSYLMLIVETAIESVLAVRLDFRTTKWTLWCAYFCLEEDEGDEQLFSDSTDLNEHWLKLWEDLIDESVTGKSMTLGDTIKLFEMHPFVDEHRLQTRKHKSVPVMDSDKIHNSLTKIWRRLNSWANDPITRQHLACDSRWIRLSQIRRRVLLESRKGDHRQSDDLCRITVIGNSAFSDIGSRHSLKSNHFSDVVNEEARTTGSPVAEAPGALQYDMACCSGSSSNQTVGDSSNPESSCDVTMPSSSSRDDNFVVNENVLGGKLLHCKICAHLSISATNTATIKDHCALHAIMEGRMLCALYIHRAADRPQSCPFCCIEINIYKAMEFIEHMKMKHMEKARMIYDRYLHRYFPQSKIFSGPYPPTFEAADNSFSRGDFIIRCQRSDCCGVNPVVVLPYEKTIQLSDVDIAVVKHILWHVRNDSFLDLNLVEMDLLTRALMIRLSSSQTRQILFMARRVTKEFYRYSEPDVVKYIQAKMDEIGFVLFGINKGLVFQMVFTRRFVRDQSGMLIYPPCVCRLCVDKELPRYSSDRRKRAFVAYAHPVVLHILEHLSARQLPERLTSSADNLRWKSSCRMDGLRFKSVSTAIRHVLHAHNELVEISALDIVLEDMGVFQIFRDAMSVVLGEQSWQLEEALGFGAYNVKPCPKPAFFSEEPNEHLVAIHRADCAQHWDPSAALCTCESMATQEAASSSETTSQFRNFRLKTTSLRDMPEESAACYEEFLHGVEGHEGVELPSPNAAVTNTEESCDQARTTQSMLPSNGHDLSEPVVAPLVSVKVELTEEHSDNQPVIDQTILPAGLPTDRLRSDERTKQQRKRLASKKAKQKLKEIKREIDGIVLPQRNKALPLKNVIQGPKTVAAALVAALGSPTKTASSLPVPPRSPLPQARGETGEELDCVFPNDTEGASNPLSNSRRAATKVVARGEKESQSDSGFAAKKPRLVSANENNNVEAPKSDSSSTRSKRRLRSSSRRKPAISEPSLQ
ncbi:hypothetical protein RB195_019359 [Necator americanus]